MSGQNFPEYGLYDVMITLNKGGQLETSRGNAVPQTWEQACRWVRVLMRLAHHGVDGFAQVEDCNIVRISVAQYFEDDALRVEWLADQVASMERRRRVLRGLDLAVERVLALIRHGEVDRAGDAVGNVLDCAVEIVCHFPEESASMRDAALRVDGAMAAANSAVGGMPLSLSFA